MFWILLACSDPEPKVIETPKDGPLKVWSLSHPVGYLVSQIGGRFIEHDVLLPDMEDARTWRPSPDQIVELSTADVIFSSGFLFESWLQTASLPTGKVIPTAVNFNQIFIDGKTHSHGKDGAHSHAEVDPRVWSDPDIYRHQAQTILTILSDNDPINNEAFVENHHVLSLELDALVAETRPIANNLQSQSIAANKPLYNYFARRFDISIKSFDLDANSDLDSANILAPKLWTQGKPTVVMLWDSDPTEQLKSALSNFTHLRIDPLENPPAAGSAYDYPEQYRANLAVFDAFISSSADTPDVD